MGGESYPHKLHVKLQAKYALILGHPKYIQIYKYMYLVSSYHLTNLVYLL